MIAIFFSRPLTLTIISFGICVKPSPECSGSRAGLARECARRRRLNCSGGSTRSYGVCESQDFRRASWGAARLACAVRLDGVCAKRSRRAPALMPPGPTRECARKASRPEGPLPPRVPLVRRGLYPARAASARNCSPETPSDRAPASGRVGLSREMEARGLRSPHGRCVECAPGDGRRPYAYGLSSGLRKNFQPGRGTRVRPGGRSLVLPLKNLALSLLEVRARVSGLLARSPTRAVPEGFMFRQTGQARSV